MNSKQMFPSEFLKSDDLSSKPEEVTMDKVTVREFQDPITKESEEKPLLHFVGVEKTLILNKTNWDRIAEMYGDESDKWKGKKIKLHLEAITAFGKKTDAIRVLVEK